jgi:hypothetical protein
MTSSIAAIHVAKKQLGLDEDTYRAKLQLIVGKDSTKAMTEAERQRVLQVFRNEGFKPVSKPRPDGRKKLSGPYATKLQALWIAGWNLAVFRDRDDAALIAFVKRQTGLDAVQFVRFQDDAAKAIEALKKIMTREASVDWKPSRFMPAHTQVDGYRVAKAQWKLLGEAGDVMHFALETVGKPRTAALDHRDWIIVMNLLGKRVRALRAVADV